MDTLRQLVISAVLGLPLTTRRHNEDEESQAIINKMRATTATMDYEVSQANRTVNALASEVNKTYTSVMNRGVNNTVHNA